MQAFHARVMVFLISFSNHMVSIATGALQRVLVLGSGFTSGPLIEYLTRDGRTAVTVGKLLHLRSSNQK